MYVYFSLINCIFNVFICQFIFNFIFTLMIYFTTLFLNALLVHHKINIIVFIKQ